MKRWWNDFETDRATRAHERGISLTEYRIFETDRFRADVEHIAESAQNDLAKKLKIFVYPQRRRRPHFGPHVRKLRNWEPETWRYRVGSWRFFYEIDEQEAIVFLTGAEHRSSAHGRQSDRAEPVRTS
jgi:mRNA interferase RelE/StbE